MDAGWAKDGRCRMDHAISGKYSSAHLLLLAKDKAGIINKWYQPTGGQNLGKGMAGRRKRQSLVGTADVPISGVCQLKSADWPKTGEAALGAGSDAVDWLTKTRSVIWSTPSWFTHDIS